MIVKYLDVSTNNLYSNVHNGHSAATLLHLFISIQDMQESHLFTAHCGQRCQSQKLVKRSLRRTTWPQNGLAVSSKVVHRKVGEGLFGASVLARATGSSPSGVCAALVKLNCETDFVARNALLFGRLSDLAHTATCLAESGPGSGSDDQM